MNAPREPSWLRLARAVAPSAERDWLTAMALELPFVPARARWRWGVAALALALRWRLARPAAPPFALASLLTAALVGVLVSVPLRDAARVPVAPAPPASVEAAERPEREAETSRAEPVDEFAALEADAALRALPNPIAGGDGAAARGVSAEAAPTVAESAPGVGSDAVPDDMTEGTSGPTSDPTSDPTFNATSDETSDLEPAENAVAAFAEDADAPREAVLVVPASSAVLVARRPVSVRVAGEERELRALEQLELDLPAHVHANDGGALELRAAGRALGLLGPDGAARELWLEPARP